MPESIELFDQIAIMRNDIEDISAISEALLRFQGEPLVASVLEFFRGDAAARAIYFLCDGKRNQKEICEELIAHDVKGGSGPQVTRKLKIMVRDFHLLAPDHRRGKSQVYRKTIAGRALQIDRALEKEGLWGF